MQIRPRRCTTALAALALLGGAGCGGSSRSRPPNLLLVVVDTLRQDHLGCYGYGTHPTSPQLDALAREAVQLTGLTAASSWTMPSMATLLTGLPPAAHGVSGLLDVLTEPQTLAAVLRERGYATGCIMANLLLAAARLGRESGFARGYDFYDDQITLGEDPHRGSTAPEVARRGLAWLQEQDTARPWFLMLHFFDPHQVYEDHPEYGFADPAYGGWVKAGMRRTEIRRHIARCGRRGRRQMAAYYDGEVRAVDDALGAVLAALRQRPDWQDTLVVFTADHGEELAERGAVGHTVTLHFEITDLPLVVRLPGGARAGAKVTARLPQEGLFATILELCGVPVPPGRGAAFTTGILGTGPCGSRPCFSEVDFVPGVQKFTDREVRKRSVIDGGFKLIRDLRAGEERLYRLEASFSPRGLFDPLERRDLAADPAWDAVRARLGGLVDSHGWLEGVEVPADRPRRRPASREDPAGGGTAGEGER